MLVYKSLPQLSRIRRPLVLAAGAFDGVHRGHVSVIRQALTAAKAMGGEAWVLTFEPHPLRVLKPDQAPARLTSRDHRLKLLHAAGVDGCLVLPFTRQLAAVEPEDFVARLLSSAPSLKSLVVGENWTFGRRARGDVKLLRKLVKAHRIDVKVAAPLLWRKAPISSTRIRDAVAAGKLAAAASMLGRPFSIRGDVVHGKKLGRKLGYPTANVDPHNEVRPPEGIYAAYATVRDRKYPAAVYLNNRSLIVEAYLLDQKMDLYGQEIELSFVKKVGVEKPFKTLAGLKKKIAADIAAVRLALAPRD